ncbi:TIGR03773 family transporter-associated surface protein [Corynebacterium felinum]|uniref:ABC transporter-associated repeat protein n=1 Tax=Corynebacterium felinum TaxID=131318 RepID=A0ABU2B938_9CORY|nr:TIGR03773 family transporter-associated surface protein [Corynebacterium felinum]MDF5821523.1 TIGR03773 family transporter-associated surface protein [Corynebacterium felinum]MDR7355120.1 putative ABC transporter-associated repeat protein [Corynebacterium felinum]WJY94471.1 hypothetical protein CFELI_04190 [Corynebacterium felinum]
MNPRAPRTVALLIALIFLTVLSPRALAQSIRFNEGHVDLFTVRATDGGLELVLKEDITGGGVIQQPENVLLVVGANTYTDATERVSAIGQPTYFLPQSQEAGKLWPGWDTLAVRQGGYSAIEFHFDSVTGPGEIYIFETQGFDSINPIAEGGEFTLTTGSVIKQNTPAHRHVNWAFTKPGTYSMQVTAHGNGSQSNTATYTWQVGENTGGNPGQSRNENTTAPQIAPNSQNNQQILRTPQGAGNSNSATVQSGGHVAAQPNQARSGGTAQQCEPTVMPMIKDDTTVPATWRNFNELAFHLGSASEKELPVSIGPVPQGKVWMIGSTQEPNVPWLGSNTQHPTMLAHTQGGVTWELVGFTGPGPMVVYSQGGLGTIVGQEWFRGANNQAQGTHTIPANSHVHPNWVFGAPGTYHVSIRQQVTLQDGSQAASTDTIVFHVGSGAQSGHFDIGAAINPNGNNCDAGFEAAQQLPPVEQATPGANSPADAEAKNNNAVPDAQSALNAQGQALKATSLQAELTLAERIVRFLPYVILGLGLFVMGAGSTTLMNALNSRKHKAHTDA